MIYLKNIHLKLLIFFLALNFFGCSKNEEKPVKEIREDKDEYEFVYKNVLNFIGKEPIKREYVKDTVNHNDYSKEKVDLGKKLFHDIRLSKNNTVSCSSCHNLERGGMDNLPVAIGINGQKGFRNTPTVFNAALNFKQFWDGRAENVEQQAGMPILNPIEMGMESREATEIKIREIDEYRELFKKAFPHLTEPITFETITLAIGSFERTFARLSRFDKYIAGDKKILTQQEKRGAHLFISNKCFQCHKGSLVGGLKFGAFGTTDRPYWIFTGSKRHDLGAIEVTGKDYDYLQFKAPSLRNVENTAPYFHDGSVKSLQKAIKIMAKIQFETDLTDEEAESIEAFLKTLTSE